MYPHVLREELTPDPEYVMHVSTVKLQTTEEHTYNTNKFSAYTHTYIHTYNNNYLSRIAGIFVTESPKTKV